MESLIREKTCHSCGERVPENCVRCRMCGEFLHEQTREHHNRTASSGAEWMVAYGGQQFGPFHADQLREVVKQNSVPASAMVWKPGMSDWVTIDKVAALNQA